MKATDTITEALARVEHEQWCDWMRYFLNKKCVYNPGVGTSTIPEDYLAALWVLVNTPYDRLSDEQKDNDRREVERYWPLIAPLIDAAIDVDAVAQDPRGVVSVETVAVDKDIFNRFRDALYATLTAEKPG